MTPPFQKLLEIAQKLRAEGGCPWDREQTISSLVPLLADEVEELRQAVDKQDWENLEEELGDVLFNLIMISQIASENGHFNITGVLEKITEKLISRHTWVFGTDKAETAEEALALWKANKTLKRSESAPKKNQ